MKSKILVLAFIGIVMLISVFCFSIDVYAKGNIENRITREIGEARFI
ncbi:MAG: hypothetical protein ACOYWZ_15725 [Bacillota bacterium]